MHIHTTEELALRPMCLLLQNMGHVPPLLIQE